MTSLYKTLLNIQESWKKFKLMFLAELIQTVNKPCWSQFDHVRYASHNLADLTIDTDAGTGTNGAFLNVAAAVSGLDIYIGEIGVSASNSDKITLARFNSGLGKPAIFATWIP